MDDLGAKDVSGRFDSGPASRPSPRSCTPSDAGPRKDVRAISEGLLGPTGLPVIRCHPPARPDTWAYRAKHHTEPEARLFRPGERGARSCRAPPRDVAWRAGHRPSRGQHVARLATKFTA